MCVVLNSRSHVKRKPNLGQGLRVQYVSNSNFLSRWSVSGVWPRCLSFSSMHPGVLTRWPPGRKCSWWLRSWPNRYRTPEHTTTSTQGLFKYQIITVTDQLEEHEYFIETFLPTQGNKLNILHLNIAYRTLIGLI